MSFTILIKELLTHCASVLDGIARRIRHDERGLASSVDMLLTLPLFATMILLQIQVCLIGRAQVLAEVAAFRAARSAIVNEEQDGIYLATAAAYSALAPLGIEHRPDKGRAGSVRSLATPWRVPTTAVPSSSATLEGVRQSSGDTTASVELRYNLSIPIAAELLGERWYGQRVMYIRSEAALSTMQSRER